MTNLDSILKSKDINLSYSQNYGLSSSHVWMWELDHKEGWAPKNWCFWNVVLKKTLESPLDCKEIQPVDPKGNQPRVFIRRTDTEVEAPILWLRDAKNCTHWKRPWCWERLKTKVEEGSRGWDGWMASSIQWTWTWVNSGRWWGSGRSGVLQFMGMQRVGHSLVSEKPLLCFSSNHLVTFPWPSRLSEDREGLLSCPQSRIWPLSGA